MLEVIRAGFSAQIQDFGRYGYLGQGVTHGGPMDEHAFLWGNYLLGNPFFAPQLEITLGGFSAHFASPASIALCGADMRATADERPLAPWRTHFIATGATLSVRTPKSGVRGYVAIKGGFQVPRQLGSSSTVTREKLGGVQGDGSALQNGDTLPYVPSECMAPRQVPNEFIPDYTGPVVLRFIPNLSTTGCGGPALSRLTTQTFTLSQQINRMGYRLSGEPVTGVADGIISQGVTLGAIQIPRDGQPIVLMRDHQTMGGYPLAGCVAHLDLARLAQAQPGAAVTFVPAALDELEEALLAYQKFFGVTDFGRSGYRGGVSAAPVCAQTGSNVYPTPSVPPR